MHGGWADDFPLEGFTRGFASGVPQSTDPNYTNVLQIDQHLRDRRRRIDHILIPCAHQSHLKAGFPTFPASSDHKALVLHLKNSSSPTTNKRIRCPKAFLRDPDTVAAIEVELGALQHDNETQWSLAPDTIHMHAIRYERIQRK